MELQATCERIVGDHYVMLRLRRNLSVREREKFTTHARVKLVMTSYPKTLKPMKYYWALIGEVLHHWIVDETTRNDGNVPDVDKEQVSAIIKANAVQELNMLRAADAEAYPSVELMEEIAGSWIFKSMKNMNEREMSFLISIVEKFASEKGYSINRSIDGELVRFT